MTTGVEKIKVKFSIRTSERLSIEVMDKTYAIGKIK
jgi:hypothetical protein